MCHGLLVQSGKALGWSVLLHLCCQSEPSGSNIGDVMLRVRTAWSTVVRLYDQSWTYLCVYVYFVWELLAENVFLASLRLSMSWFEFPK